MKNVELGLFVFYIYFFIVNLSWLNVVFSSPKHIKLNHQRFKFSDLKISGRQVTKIIYSVITEE